MNKKEFLTNEEKEATKDSGLEDLESNVEVNILEKEAEKEKYCQAFDEGETNDKNKWLEEQAERITTYLNEDNIPYLRNLKMKKGSCSSDYVLQHFENGIGWVTGRGRCQNIPLNLKNVINTVKNDGTVIITNSEQDAILLTEKFNFCGTTAITNNPARWNNNCNKYITKNAKVIIIKEESNDAKEFAKVTLEKVKYYAKVAKCISIKKLCEILNLECTEKTGVNEIRDMLQDDEKLKEVFQTLIDSIN